VTEAPYKTRLSPGVFRLPVEKIRQGYYTDAYFNFTKELLEDEGRHPQVTMQVFQKRDAVLGGVDEAIAVLKECAGRYVDGHWEGGWDQLEVQALHEGDEVAPWESVLMIEGDYTLFAHLETVYLGTLARRTLVMTNVRGVVDAANGKPILYFPARHDQWRARSASLPTLMPRGGADAASAPYRTG
jgi:nicotinate phosphoribosyltransferase